MWITSPLQIHTECVFLIFLKSQPIVETATLNGKAWGIWLGSHTFRPYIFLFFLGGWEHPLNIQIHISSKSLSRIKVLICEFFQKSLKII